MFTLKSIRQKSKKYVSSRYLYQIVTIVSFSSSIGQGTPELCPYLFQMKNWPGLSYVPSFTYTDDRTTRLRQSLKYLYSISTNKIHQNRFSGPILEEEIKTYNLFSHDHSGPCTLNDLPILPGPKLHRNWNIFFPSIIGPLKSTDHHQRPLF